MRAGIGNQTPKDFCQVSRPSRAHERPRTHLRVNPVVFAPLDATQDHVTVNPLPSRWVSCPASFPRRAGAGPAVRWSHCVNPLHYLSGEASGPDSRYIFVHDVHHGIAKSAASSQTSS